MDLCASTSGVSELSVFVGNSGSSLRLASGMLDLRHGKFHSYVKHQELFVDEILINDCKL